VRLTLKKRKCRTWSTTGGDIVFIDAVTDFVHLIELADLKDGRTVTNSKNSPFVLSDSKYYVICYGLYYEVTKIGSSLRYLCTFVTKLVYTLVLHYSYTLIYFCLNEALSSFVYLHFLFKLFNDIYVRSKSSSL
jgi:hypothetical protein